MRRTPKVTAARKCGASAPERGAAVRFKVGNVAWSGLDAMFGSIQALVAAFVVARLVGPAEVGIGATVVATQLIAAQILSSLSDVIVQRERMDERIASSATCYLLLTAFGLGVAVFGAGLPVGALLEDQRVVAMSVWMAASLLPHAYAAALSQWLVRQRDFRTLFWRGAVSATVAMIVGIGMAVFGWGAWAVVVPSAAIPFLSAAVTAWLCPWHPSWRWRWREVAPLLPFAVPQMFNGLAWGVRYRLFFTVLAASATPQAMGFVHMAFRAVDSVGVLLFSTAQRLMLPQMARLQTDVPTLRGVHDRFVRLVALVALPAFAGLGLCVAPVFRLGLGPGWEPAAAGAVPLAVLGAWQAWRLPTGAANTARGLSGPTMLLGFFVLGLTLGLQLLLRPTTPVSAALVWIAPMALSIWPSQLIARRALHASLWALLRPGLPAMAATLVALGAAVLAEALVVPEGVLTVLLFRASAFSVIYTAIAVLMLGDDLREALTAAGLAGVRPVQA